MNVVPSRLRRLAVVAVVAAAAALPATQGAVAASCAVMTFEFDPQQGALVLSPTSVSVQTGQCVAFNNQTLTEAQFTVGSGYRTNVAPLTTTTDANSYIAQAAGTQRVTASSATGSASGSIVVRARPRPSQRPTPSPTSAPSSPAPQSAPPPTQSANATSPTPAPSAPKASSPPVLPVQSSPPGTSPFLAGPGTPSPQSSPSTAVVAGPLQPPTGRGTGLPAALAALAIVGTAAALLRVLLAEPVSSVRAFG